MLTTATNLYGKLIKLTIKRLLCLRMFAITFQHENNLSKLAINLPLYEITKMILDFIYCVKQENSILHENPTAIIFIIVEILFDISFSNQDLKYI